MINFNSSIDFKNINAGEIVKNLAPYQNALIKGVFMMVALVVAGVLFKNDYLKGQHRHTQILQAQQKLSVIASQQETVNKLNNFKTSFPKSLDEDKIITQITSYASARSISISSFSPGERKDMGLYDISKFSLSGVAPDYKSMVLFLRDMEKSQYFFIVDSWKGQGQGEINFNTDISVVHIRL